MMMMMMRALLMSGIVSGSYNGCVVSYIGFKKN